MSDATSGLEVEVLGERRPARTLAAPPYDPAGERMRA
jgi:glycine cleavage system aminomethyltransferase T